MSDIRNLKKGSHNLLTNCANLKMSEKLLIISEDEKFGWYSKDVAEFVYNEAKIRDINVDILYVGEPTNDNKEELKSKINEYDCTIFFARIGDQDRFENNSFKNKRVMCYVKNSKSLASSFGCTHHHAMLEIKEAINNLIFKSNQIEITCPLGTKVFGKINPVKSIDKNEVSVLRFPAVVPAPVLANNFSGEVFLNGYLTTTGSKVYKPDYIKLDKPVIVILDSGKIVKFLGNSNDVANVENHYQHVSRLFNINEKSVHSWHAGIHPGVIYERPINENPDRWSNNIFASPKYLHFHTCGDYAPGEICWMILNHTVKIDGKALWENGKLNVEFFEETKDCINKWKDLKTLYMG